MFFVYSFFHKCFFLGALPDVRFCYFRRLVDTRHEMKIMFEKFLRGLENHSLENHALLVMDSIGEAISNLDDEGYTYYRRAATHQRRITSPL